MSIFSSLFGPKKSIEFSIKLKEEDKHPQYRLELFNSQVFTYPIYGAKEDLSGRVNIHVPGSTRLEHTGINIELIGCIIDFTTGATITEFAHEEKTLESAGVIMGKQSFKFSFKKVSKKYESYYGINVRVRYYLRVVASRSFGPNLIEERDVWIVKADKQPSSNKNIKMEVGIEDCLHIEFQYNQENYHLHDCIMGTIHFILAKIKILHMDIEIVRKEIVGEGDKAITENETLAKFEIMDGMPIKDEIIPVRVYLQPYDLTPTLRNVGKVFSVKYFINLVLVDAEERRFFKQQEITLWRDTEKFSS